MERIGHLVTIGEAMLAALQELEMKLDMPMTRQQAAVYLGVSKSTINNYVKRGLKPTVKHGIVGYLAADLEKFRK